MSLINKEVSEFSVQAFQDNAFKTVTKADILGKWSVFFFYPADFTFVCPTELEDLAEKYEDFKSIGCEIYSVSCDSHFVHKAWHDASKTIQKIKYPMLADPTGALARDFDVMIESKAWPSGAVSSSTPKGASWLMKSSPGTWAATRTNCSAGCRLPSSWPRTTIRCALPSGVPARKP